LQAPSNPTLLIVDGSTHREPSVCELVECAQALSWQVVTDTVASDAALVVTNRPPTPDERRVYGRALVIGAGVRPTEREVDILLPSDPDRKLLSALLVQARRIWSDGEELRQMQQALDTGKDQIRQLAEIGTVLTAERNDTALLETILREARRLANCEAGSLYLVEHQDGDHSLSFKLAQNDLRPVALSQARLPLSPESLAGFVAMSGQELRIADAYAIPDGAPYRFNRSVDETIDYRTRSMLVLPMCDHRDEVIGVLQFINRTRHENGVDTIADFDDEIVALLRAVASQAAVAMQKNKLIQDINELFESFVQASVKAIEQRDPSTSGHSFRVAQTTTALLSALPESGLARFRGLTISDEHLREVRYAALLHDFGKVGVRESVLLKANKLTDESLEIIRYRFELQKERLRRSALERELHLLHSDASAFDVLRRGVHRDLQQQTALLDDYLAAVVEANRPRLMDEGALEDLDRVHQVMFSEFDGSSSGLINSDQLEALTIRRGSLTETERREIEAHVSFTRDFLAVLPWPPELMDVSRIAAAHHEKLDGTGYPEGLKSEQIPLPSKVMAVCDIFDALTAMDRPYKDAIPDDRAFAILEDEAAAGLIDGDLVRIFIEARIFELTRVDAIPQQAAG
jgi:HD-GYP domain-containing protein (c-di-GMP phosphodiesterase class II)